MATAGNIQGGDSFGNILSLVNLLKGTTTTTKSNITPQGIQALINQQLGSVNGLGAIASGTKTAGLYNSTTQQLLTNDLVTRTAGELAKQQAGTTTTTPAKIGPTDILGLVALSAGKNLLGPTITGLGKKYGIDKFGDNIADKFGVGQSSDLMSNSANFAPLPEPDAIDLFSGTGVTDTVASLGSSLLGDTGTAIASDTAEEGGGGLLDWIFG